ncbi:MAG: hypothetical protein KIT22_20050, partial [Verrucomicrobiae bacterium]|nr:hypothetical protein [Verrucomicrobiae bacterium]
MNFPFRQLLKTPGFTAVAVSSRTSCPAISRSIRPGDSMFLFGVHSPEKQAGRHDSNHSAHSLSLGIQGRVATQKASDEVRYFILSDRQDHQTVGGVAEWTTGQPQVASEERRMGKCPQQRKNLFISRAFA